MLERLNVVYDSLELLSDDMWRVGGRGDALLDAWFVLNTHKTETHHSPLLIGSEQSLALIWEFWAENAGTAVADIEERAEALDGRTFLQQRWDAEVTSLQQQQDPDEQEALHALTQVNASAMTYDPQAANLDGFFAIWDTTTQNISEQCFLLLIPTPDETAAHAYLRYGGWNSYPRAEEHIAVLRYWREKYGATLVSLTADTVELRLEQPIQDPHHRWPLR